MKAIIAGLAGLVLLLMILHWIDRRAYDADREAWKADTTRLAEQLAVGEAEAAIADAERNRLRLRLDSLEAAREPLPQPRPPLPRPDPPAGTASDSATFWKREAVAARAEAETLRTDVERVRRETFRLGAIVATQAARIRLDSLSLVRVEAERDSAVALMRRVPQAPRCRILFIPCPVVTAGYGALVSDGGVRHGPGATVGWEVRP